MRRPKRLNEKLKAYFECKAVFNKLKMKDLMKKEGQKGVPK